MKLTASERQLLIEALETEIRLLASGPGPTHPAEARRILLCRGLIQRLLKARSSPRTLPLSS